MSGLGGISNIRNMIVQGAMAAEKPVVNPADAKITDAPKRAKGVTAPMAHAKALDTIITASTKPKLKHILGGKLGRVILALWGKNPKPEVRTALDKVATTQEAYAALEKSAQAGNTVTEAQYEAAAAERSKAIGTLLNTVNDIVGARLPEIMAEHAVDTVSADNKNAFVAKLGFKAGVSVLVGDTSESKTATAVINKVEALLDSVTSANAAAKRTEIATIAKELHGIYGNKVAKFGGVFDATGGSVAEETDTAEIIKVLGHMTRAALQTWDRAGTPAFIDARDAYLTAVRAIDSTIPDADKKIREQGAAFMAKFAELHKAHAFKKHMDPIDLHGQVMLDREDHRRALIMNLLNETRHLDGADGKDADLEGLIKSAASAGSIEVAGEALELKHLQNFHPGVTEGVLRKLAPLIGEKNEKWYSVDLKYGLGVREGSTYHTGHAKLSGKFFTQDDWRGYFTVSGSNTMDGEKFDVRAHDPFSTAGGGSFGATLNGGLRFTYGAPKKENVDLKLGAIDLPGGFKKGLGAGGLTQGTFNLDEDGVYTWNGSLAFGGGAIFLQPGQTYQQWLNPSNRGTNAGNPKFEVSDDAGLGLALGSTFSLAKEMFTISTKYGLTATFPAAQDAKPVSEYSDDEPVTPSDDTQLAHKFDVGLGANFWKGRLGLSFDYTLNVDKDEAAFNEWKAGVKSVWLDKALSFKASYGKIHYESDADYDVFTASAKYTLKDLWKLSFGLDFSWASTTEESVKIVGDEWTQEELVEQKEVDVTNFTGTIGFNPGNSPVFVEAAFSYLNDSIGLVGRDSIGTPRFQALISTGAKF